MSVVESRGYDSGFPKNLTLLLPVAFGNSTWRLQEHRATKQSRAGSRPAMPWHWKGPAAIPAGSRQGWDPKVPEVCYYCALRHWQDILAI